MVNAEYFPNKGEIPTYSKDHPAPAKVAEYHSYWTLDMYGPRRPVLIVEDMENDYRPYVDYATPNAVKALAAFRNASLPVIWTNWARRPWDGNYGALDRFYGPTGLPNSENTMYIYDETSKDGTETMEELKPLTPEEKSLTIKSFHLSKFADLDENGDEILFPILRAWRTNTLVIVGSWTDDCVAATVTEAVDRYGLDAVIVTDAIASGTKWGESAFHVMKDGLALTVTADELAEYLQTGTNFEGPPPGVPIDASARKIDNRPRGKDHGGPTVSLWLLILVAALSFGVPFLFTASLKNAIKNTITSLSPRNLRSSYTRITNETVAAAQAAKDDNNLP